MKKQDDFLIAHVEIEKARFSHGEDMGYEFRNQIDSWTRMMVHFRHQIQNPRKRSKQGKHDLAPLVYSIRQKLD